jgi:hypothetical protein
MLRSLFRLEMTVTRFSLSFSFVKEAPSLFEVGSSFEISSDAHQMVIGLIRILYVLTPTLLRHFVCS